MAVLMALFVGSCGTTLQYIEDGPIALDDNMGLLVVHTNSDTTIDDISINSSTWIEGIPQGSHTQMVALPEGEYQWHVMRWTTRLGKVKWSLKDKPMFAFRVEAGQINYPGELVVTRRMGYLEAFTRNRSAMLWNRVRQIYPDLIKNYPIKYTGFQRDDFFDYYQRITSHNTSLAKKH